MAGLLEPRHLLRSYEVRMRMGVWVLCGMRVCCIRQWKCALIQRRCDDVDLASTVVCAPRTGPGA